MKIIPTMMKLHSWDDEEDNLTTNHNHNNRQAVMGLKVVEDQLSKQLWLTTLCTGRMPSS